jgi:hypothetical protein
MLPDLATICLYWANFLPFKIPKSQNLSYPTSCAEEDNINFPIYASGVSDIVVKATHPKYLTLAVRAYCHEDFSGCPNTLATKQSSSTVPSSQKIFDNGDNVFWVYTEANWWRPYQMSITINGNTYQSHRLELNKKIIDANSWPVVMVIYEDGSMRIKPQAPIGVLNDNGVNDTCFGSSIIIGPAVESTAKPPRPFVDIAGINIVDSTTPCLDIAYLNGGSEHLCVSVNRSEAVVKISPKYSSAAPFVTFRSMRVADGNSDVDHVNQIPIAVPSTPVYGPTWVFSSQIKSKHNTSSPDISISIPYYHKPIWKKILMP